LQNSFTDQKQTRGRGRVGGDRGGMAEAGTGRQLEDPLLQEAEAQMKDSPVREGELCGLEVQARRLGEHVEDRQTHWLVRAKGGRG
jgi:hypothetical protein